MAQPGEGRGGGAGAAGGGGGRLGMSRPFASLELLLRLSRFFVFIYLIIHVALFAWKGTVLYYNNSDLASEIVLLILLLPVELTRIFFCRKGNLTLQKQPLLLSLALSVPVGVAFFFFIYWQTYVLRLEFGFGITALALLGLEVLLTLAALVRFSQDEAFRR